MSIQSSLGRGRRAVIGVLLLKRQTARNGCTKSPRRESVILWAYRNLRCSSRKGQTVDSYGACSRRIYIPRPIHHPPQIRYGPLGPEGVFKLTSVASQGAKESLQNPVRQLPNILHQIARMYPDSVTSTGCFSRTRVGSWLYQPGYRLSAMQGVPETSHPSTTGIDRADKLLTARYPDGIPVLGAASDPN
jgi:hypothetical protein